MDIFRSMKMLIDRYSVNYVSALRVRVNNTHYTHIPKYSVQFFNHTHLKKNQIFRLRLKLFHFNGVLKICFMIIFVQFFMNLQSEQYPLHDGHGYCIL